MTTPDVLDREDLPFPGSLPEFQRLFPHDAACAAYLEAIRIRSAGGASRRWAPQAQRGHTRYTGEVLRKLRAVRGVGAPPGIMGGVG